jgi:syntaxin 6
LAPNFLLTTYGIPKDSAANAHELKESKKQLKRSIVQAESTLQDLQLTVSLVESDRAKFRHIDDKELYDRSALVNTSRDRIQRAKYEMNSEAVKAKLLQDERAKAVRRAETTALGARTETERENTSLIVDAQARQSLLMQHQDETLDELDMAVTRVNHMAGIMHDEIGQQNKMLTEMEEDLSNVEEELGMVMGKLAKFLKTKDTWQLGTIVCLLVTCVILFFMVLYI